MNTSISTSSIAFRKRLSGVVLKGGRVERDLVNVGGTPVVLMHKEHPLLKPHFDQAQWRRFASASSVPASIQNEVKAWNRSLRFSANCHTVAIGAFLGLAGTDWLEGSCSDITLKCNPAQDLLNHFFQVVGVGSKLDDIAIGLQHDDVIVFQDSSNSELVHSGRVRIHGQELLLLSKFGEHPVAAVRLDRAAEIYAGEFDKIVVYRWNGETPSE